jgi:hypothetical protein
LTTDAADRLATRFRRQADSAIQRGSPLYTSLLHRVAEDILSRGPCLDLLSSRAGERAGQALPLRFMAGAHRLALAGRAPDLAAHFPSAGGDADAEAAWTALSALVSARAQELDALLDLPLQTNEVGRSRALVSGHLAVAARTGLPLRLLEIGASAGLNLNLPRYRFESEAGVIGDPHASVRFECAPWPPPTPRLEVIEARGCDTHPLDAREPADRLTLRCAVWADQAERLALLDGALAVAEEHPPEVVAAEALDWLAGIRPARGTATVIYHSIVEQYLEPAAREQLTSAITALVREASDEAPVAWLSLERPMQRGTTGLAEVRLALSPDPERRLLGHTSYHGSPLS